MANPAAADAARSNVTDEIILKARRERQDARNTLETAKARYRNCGKKIESWGIDLKELDRVIEFTRRDPDELKDDFATFIRYCRVLQVPIGTQLTLLDEELPEVDISEKAKEEQAAWDAGQQGFMAGKNNEPNGNNPYPPGSLAYSAWSEGHRRGAQMVADGLVVKRGRPKKEPEHQENQQAA